MKSKNWSLAKRVLGSARPITVPWAIKLMQRVPVLRRIPARVIGMGLRPEHVKTAERPRTVA